MTVEISTPSDVIGFWREAGPSKWFARDDAFDLQCQGLLSLHFAAARGDLDAWRNDAAGLLALLVLLDQIPRNVFRGSAHSYATDPLAKSLAVHAIAAGFDLATDEPLRMFFYLPFEHSESLDDQRLALQLHRERLTTPDADRWARLHLDIIERFGRFPHRNAALGRESTPAERAFLAEGGFAG
ncbi:DUF924 family protein [Cognatilysobacter lacus]|uniref:DUF924 family protein n=1 Tax=Cognatilysobacter lacus TaxID=1643323 RepID=A0A5D8Z5J9_9GAMM|nr:DUF924 family protein [Lysobacter lacus]TZF90255.1 DUF924 family protein [Lysobacter lacus]